MEAENHFQKESLLAGVHFQDFRIHVHFQVVLRAGKLKSMNLGKRYQVKFVTAKHHAAEILSGMPLGNS